RIIGSFDRRARAVVASRLPERARAGPRQDVGQQGDAPFHVPGARELARDNPDGEQRRDQAPPRPPGPPQLPPPLPTAHPPGPPVAGATAQLADSPVPAASAVPESASGGAAPGLSAKAIAVAASRPAVLA